MSALTLRWHEKVYVHSIIGNQWLRNLLTGRELVSVYFCHDATSLWGLKREMMTSWFLDVNCEEPLTLIHTHTHKSHWEGHTHTHTHTHTHKHTQNCAKMTEIFVQRGWQERQGEKGRDREGKGGREGERGRWTEKRKYIQSFLCGTQQAWIVWNSFSPSWILINWILYYEHNLVRHRTLTHGLK